MLGGGILMLVTYGVTAFFTKRGLATNPYRVDILGIVGLLIGAFVIALFTSFMIAAYFIEEKKDFFKESTYSSSVEWFDILVPMLIASMLAIFISAWQRKQELHKYWSQDHHPIRNIERMHYEE